LAETKDKSAWHEGPPLKGVLERGLLFGFRTTPIFCIAAPKLGPSLRAPPSFGDPAFVRTECLQIYKDRSPRRRGRVLRIDYNLILDDEVDVLADSKWTKARQ